MNKLPSLSAKSILLAFTLIAICAFSTLLSRAQTNQEINDQPDPQTEAQAESQSSHSGWKAPGKQSSLRSYRLVCRNRRPFTLTRLLLAAEQVLALIGLAPSANNTSPGYILAAIISPLLTKKTYSMRWAILTAFSQCASE
jgi:hypothetical protein